MWWDRIIDYILSTIKTWYTWLILAVVTIPLVIIRGPNYMFISISFLVIMIINIIILVVGKIKDKFYANKVCQKNFDIFFNSLWKDEQDLLIELFEKRVVYKETNEFYIEGSYGIRSKTFYNITQLPNEETSFSELKFIKVEYNFKSQNEDLTYNVNYKISIDSKFVEEWKKYLKKILQKK